MSYHKFLATILQKTEDHNPLWTKSQTLQVCITLCRGLGMSVDTPTRPVSMVSYVEATTGHKGCTPSGLGFMFNRNKVYTSPRVLYTIQSHLSGVWEGGRPFTDITIFFRKHSELAAIVLFDMITGLKPGSPFHGRLLFVLDFLENIGGLRLRSMFRSSSVDKQIKLLLAYNNISNTPVDFGNFAAVLGTTLKEVKGYKHTQIINISGVAVDIINAIIARETKKGPQ